MNDRSPEEGAPKHPCPCCDYLTLPARSDFEICPVCFWEDDGQDLDELDEVSSPNHGITLREGRANFKAFGACERDMIEHVCSPAERRAYEFNPRQTG